MKKKIGHTKIIMDSEKKPGKKFCLDIIKQESTQGIDMTLLGLKNVFMVLRLTVITKHPFY